MKTKSKVAVVYHFFPHYRSGIIKELSRSDSYEFYFYGADIASYDGIKSYSFFDDKHFIDSPFFECKGFIWQKNIVKLAFDNKVNSVIFLANPHFISTWISALLCRLMGKKVLFWTHGWTKVLPWYKSLIKNVFHRIANSLLLYGNFAKDIALKNGFSDEKCYVIYNSLDYDSQVKFRNMLNKEELTSCRASLFSKPEMPTIVCVSRLTSACNYDLLLKAAVHIKTNENIDINILFVGDGPKKQSLQTICQKNSINAVFYGACYDESLLSKLIACCDVTVSPGKVGLTAMHSLNYGVPVISHNNFELQMPEFEAIIPGVTGFFFEYNDFISLAKVIKEWIKKDDMKPNAKCYEVIDRLYNPVYQSSVIHSAINRNNAE